MKQSRMKLTWFGAVAIVLVMILCILVKVENTDGIIIASIPSLVLLIMGYHGSRAITKTAQIKRTTETIER